MKSDIDLRQELYTEQIIPIYLLEDKLKANFISIQKRFKEAQQININHERRITQLEKYKPQSSVYQLERMISQKLKDIDASSFRKEIATQVESRFRQIKLELPAQIRRESQSLVSTQLISIRRIIGQSKGGKNTKGEGESIEDKIESYNEQRQSKMIEQMREEISRIQEKVNDISYEVEDNKTHIASQLANVNNSLFRHRQHRTNDSQQHNEEAQINEQYNNGVLSSQMQKLNSKISGLVSKSQYDIEYKKLKENVSNIGGQLSLILKQLQNTDEIHSMIVKINGNIEHFEQKYEQLKSSTQEIDSVFLKAEEKNQKFKETISKKVEELEREKAQNKQREMDQMNQRVLQLERLNNYDEHMESIQRILDKHYVEEPPNPKKTLYLDYVNHLEKKVQNLGKELKLVNQRMDIQTEGTKLLEVSKTDMEEVWKAIMILENIIENRPDFQSSRKKLWSQDKATDVSKQDNRTPQKTTQTVYIRKTDTHRAGGFGQKASSSKNIKHLLDQKPEKLQRNKEKRQLIKLPQLPQESKDEQQKVN